MAKGTDAGNWCGAVNNYDFPSQIVDNLTESHGIRVCYLRGIGASQTKFALESMVDMLAEKQNSDPLAYRL